MKPPPLPEETLRRVLRTSKLNGWSVVIIATLGVLVSLALGDWSGGCVGLIVAYGGWTEVLGHRQLVRGDIEGFSRLVKAQWIVLGAIVVYCVMRLGSFDSETAQGAMSPALRSELAASGIDLAAIMPLVRFAFYATYGVVAVLTVLYQGGMVRYYRKRMPIVARAFEERRNRVVAVPRAGPAPEDLVT